MTETNLILLTMSEEVALCRSAFSDADHAASGTGFKAVLTTIRRELDGLENEIRALSSVRGLENDGIPPISHLLILGKFRVRLHFHSSDSSIGEILIRFTTGALIRITKAGNHLSDPETRAELLYLRFLGCLTTAIRSLREYL